MTVAEAEQILSWRQTDSWRGIADHCHETFMTGRQLGWIMPEHQEVGRVTTEVAKATLTDGPVLAGPTAVATDLKQTVRRSPVNTTGHGAGRQFADIPREVPQAPDRPVHVAG